MNSQQTIGRLCVLVNSLAGGGAEKVALTLFEEYQKQGIEVVFLCLEKNDVHLINKSDVYYLSDHTGQDESGARKFFSLLSLAIKLKNFVKQEQITFVQSHIYRANYVNLLAWKLGSSHLVQITNHGIASRYHGEGLLGKVNLFLIQWLYPVAGQLVCPSAGMAKDLASLDVSVDVARVIGNPFAIDDILSQSKENMEAAEFVFQLDRQYLVSVGRLDRVKHPEQIIQVLHNLQNKHPKLELLLLGTGREEKYLRMLVDRLSINGRVHFLGHVENPYKFVSRSDIFISASEFEGFSNVIVEALISGTAVVSTDCPSGPREILAPGSKVDLVLTPGEAEYAAYGVLVPVGDVPAMTLAIANMLNDEDIREKYANHGLRRAMDFGKENIARRYLEYLS
ncbi:Alpha-1,4-N-acetylgalactosamine transferase PglJ [hydrothermal vent metagenome]|uniref:Alpha-1,4-N-acetylgalactosamine transferase PglJ n=1 Tax=hydrothermal vent metagenome TaxID=652676 RepID=A0A3B1B6H9_9ZZZZ